MRQILELHRIAVACATCHKSFEPMGVALENFDAVGAWRTLDEGQPVDASGVLVDGTKVTGVDSLRDTLVRYQGQFARVVTEKLLTYGLGRGVEHGDMPLVRSIVKESEAAKYPLLVDHSRDREESGVSDEYEDSESYRAASG